MRINSHSTGNCSRCTRGAAHLDVGICVGLRCVPNQHAVALGVVAGTNCCGLDLHLSPADMRAALAHCPLMVWT